MTPEIAGFLIIFVAALMLFAFEWVSPDVTALGLMLLLIVTGLLPVDIAFAGFGSETVLMILGLLIMTETLVYTGIVDIVGRRLLDLVGSKIERLNIMLLVAPALLSSFISNTASAAFFMPIALGLANRARISAARLLMPLAFATILAGSVTLIGTSTNLVVSGLMQQQNLKPIGMFELTPVGLPILIIGLLYMYFIGRHLIPDRTGVPTDASAFEDRPYFSEIVIPPQSPEIGTTLGESRLVKELQLGVLQLYRNEETVKPLAELPLQANDVLIVEGRRENILKIQTTSGIDIQGKIETLASYVEGQETQIAEVILLPDSPLIGRSIKGQRLRERYNLQILAINQSGRVAYSRVGRRILRLGDVLLINISKENLRALEAERIFRVLDILEEPQNHNHRAFRATAIFVAALGLGIFGIFPIAVAVLLGTLMVFLTRCITPEEAYRNIEWKTLILIGSMLAFGQAMQITGTADYLAGLIVDLPLADSPIVLLGLFFILAVVLTQPMSNQAAAAILVPIAIQTATISGFNPRPFAIMIAIAASCSFITPLEPACVIVYSAGKYKFMDFIRVGGLLTIVVFVVALMLVPALWQV